MSKQFYISALLVLSGVATVHSISCYTGYILDSTILTAQEWNLTECVGNQTHCIRAEGVATVFGFLDVNVTAGICVSGDLCQDQSCDELTTEFIASDEDISESLTGVTYEIRSCDMVCCQFENCNNYTIEFIRANQPTLPAAPSTTTLQITEPPQTEAETTIEITEPSIVETTTSGSSSVGAVSQHLILLAVASIVSQL